MYRVLKSKERHSQETRDQILKAAQERVSLRGIERIFNVCRQTVAKWIKAYLKRLPVLADTLQLYEVGDVLEIDELWSFVLEKSKNAGFGLLYVVGHVKSLPSTSASATRMRHDN